MCYLTAIGLATGCGKRAERLVSLEGSVPSINAREFSHSNSFTGKVIQKNISAIVMNASETDHLFWVFIEMTNGREFAVVDSDYATNLELTRSVSLLKTNQSYIFPDALMRTGSTNN